MAIFIREEISHVESRIKLFTRNAQVCAVTLPIPFRRVNMACVYRAPGADQEEDALLLNALTTVVEEANKAFIVEDFSLPRIDWTFGTYVFG